MAGINHLRDFIDKKGIYHVSKNLKGLVIVNEKIDAVRFSFQRNGQTVKFWKRNNSKELDKVDRILDNLYEPAISFVNKNLKHFVDGAVYGCEYFPSDKPLQIHYGNIPESRLIISDITHNGIPYFSSSDTNRYIKGTGIGKAPILFEKKMTEGETEDFLDNLVDLSETDDFSAEVRHFFPKSRFIYEGEDKKSEGIVVKTLPINFLFKVTDKKFTEAIIEKKEVFHNDSLILILNTFAEWWKNKKYKAYFSPEKEIDEKYIDIISQVFQDFVKDHPFDNFDYDLPPYFKLTKYFLNYEFIKNVSLQKYLKDNPEKIQLFKILLNSLRKKRKRKHPLMNDEQMKNYNGVVVEIEAFFTNQFFQNNVEKQGEVPINVMIGRFEPFHNGHKKSIEEAFSNNGLKTILAVMNSKNSKLEHELKKEYMKEVLKNEPHIEDVIFIEKSIIGSVIRDCRKKNYEPSLFVCGEDRKEDWERQLYWEKFVNANTINTSSHVLTLDRLTEGTTIRNMIKNEQSVFELLPQYMHQYIAKIKEK